MLGRKNICTSEASNTESSLLREYLGAPNQFLDTDLWARECCVLERDINVLI